MLTSPRLHVVAVAAHLLSELVRKSELAVLHAGQSSGKTQVFAGGELEMGIWGAPAGLAGGLLLRNAGAEHEEA